MKSYSIYNELILYKIKLIFNYIKKCLFKQKLDS